MRAYDVCFPPRDGEASAVDAAVLAEFLLAWQTLLYRVTREAADLADLGRTVRPVESLSLCRVSWEGPGAVRFEVGDPTTLAVDPLADRADALMARILAGLITNRRAPGITNPIADAVDGLVRVLPKLGSTVIVGLPDDNAARVMTAELSREPWRQSRTEPVEAATVTGRLEMADLHSARFRVRDREGTPYDVSDAADPVPAARLVGTIVTVQGVLQPGTGTQHHRIEQGRIRGAGAPQPVTTLTPPDPLDFTDGEWRQFLDDHGGEF